MIIDTHAHYDDASFDEDREALFTAIQGEGVGIVVNVGASVESVKSTVALAQTHDFIYGAVGIHPEDIARLTLEDMDWLEDLARSDKIVAIGEIGLDYHYEEPARELQQEWFIRQLEMASKVQMPVIIHSREAAKDTLEIMREYCDWSQGGVIHCFSYSPEMAKNYLRQGFYLGIGGVVTFKNSKKLKEVVAMAPLEQIVLETDAPYLAPVPNRGQRNDSRQLKYVAETIAGIKGVTPEEVIRITEVNARRLYRLS